VGEIGVGAGSAGAEGREIQCGSWKSDGEAW
jgi:hypothetical protein